MNRTDPDPGALVCPLPDADPSTVQLAHGGGGRMARTLIESVFLSAFANPALAALHDGAVLQLAPGRIALTTDSYVVSPIFFPGGDIGSLAVHGTVNDLAMCGAVPQHLTAGFIIEEGLPLGDLRRIVASMAAAARAAGVTIVAGDTKVVDRGKADGLFINTAGLGLIADGVDIAPRRARPGDRVLISGDLGRHGMAILSVRQGLTFDTELVSDSAPVHGLVAAALAAAGADVHVLRDPTRGGLAAVLDEIAAAAEVAIHLDEAALPIGSEVAGACELLGLDPLYVASEGRVAALVSESAAAAVLAAWRRHPLGAAAAIIGEVRSAPAKRVVLRTRLGTERIVMLPAGEALPRIC